MNKLIFNGYMTVEACFIVPWVIFIVVWIIYLGFFEYDRCLLFQENYSLATQCAAQITTVDQQNNWLNRHISTDSKVRFVGAKKVHFEGEVSSSKVKVRSSFHIEHPLSYHAGLIPDSNWKATDLVEADNFFFTERLRTIRSVGRIFS